MILCSVVSIARMDKTNAYWTYHWNILTDCSILSTTHTRPIHALRNVLEQNFMDLNLHAVLLHSSCSTSIPFAGLFPPNEIQFPLTKNQFLLILKINFLLPKINFLLPKINFLKMEMVFIFMSINFQINAIIDVFLCLKCSL